MAIRLGSSLQCIAVGSEGVARGKRCREHISVVEIMISDDAVEKLSRSNDDAALLVQAFKLKRTLPKRLYHFKK